MTEKNPKIVRAGSGLERQAAPGETIVFKLTGGDSGGTLDYMVLTVAPNVGPPLHLHHFREETFHITKGRFKLRIGDETTICETGDFAYVPAGIPHAFLNISNEPAEFIAVYTPGGEEKFFEEFGPMMEGGAPDQEEVAALMEKHGITLLGPPLSPDQNEKQ